ncbi:MAG: oligoendopeptidase F [Treponema sp.]
MKNSTIPLRSQVAESDQWNLKGLFKNDSEWDQAIKELTLQTKTVVSYKASLQNTETLTAKTLLACLQAFETADKTAEKIGQYAFLLKSADESDPKNNERYSRFMMAASAFSAETSWFIPALLTIPEAKLRSWIDPTQNSVDDFAPYKVFIEKQLYIKAHTLSDGEEKILSLLSEPHNTAKRSFSILTNVDLNFGTIDTPDGAKELTQSSYAQFMQHPDRNIRKQAYTQFYGHFEAHKNTIASLYAGQVQQDIAFARIRGYQSAREYALYPDKIPLAVYDNLITTVRKHLAPLHRFYELMQKTLKVPELRHYDVYMPLVSEIRQSTSYADAVDLITEALQPLGSEYVNTLRNGLLNGWVDRYENKGKRSGAFSSGCFTSDPFIMMNYKEDVIRSIFTLAHEGGHSMHSWYSVHNNPFLSYHYTIFEAEVASTFNEELLFRCMLKKTTDPKMKAYLLSIRVTDILATLYRQTMFAEYEHITHKLVEQGTPLTIENLRSEYRKLLTTYFGPAMHFEDCSDLEGLRISHFYNSFYVYKYATGISASLALAERVCAGGTGEREDYFKFLKSGGSRYPTESLKIAGVDMTSSQPVEAACKHFAQLVTELESLLLTL